MGSYGFLITLIVLITAGSTAPTPRILDTLVSGITTGLEVPMSMLAGTGAGTGALQLVINVHTDSSGNIEVFTN